MPQDCWPQLFSLNEGLLCMWPASCSFSHVVTVELYHVLEKSWDPKFLQVINNISCQHRQKNGENGQILKEYVVCEIVEENLFCNDFPKLKSNVQIAHSLISFWEWIGAVIKNLRGDFYFPFSSHLPKDFKYLLVLHYMDFWVARCPAPILISLCFIPDVAILLRGFCAFENGLKYNNPRRSKNERMLNWIIFLMVWPFGNFWEVQSI